MRLKDLEACLQPIQGFSSPKPELEQYVTSAHLASRMLFTAHSSYQDIDSRSILDLGCGCGILSIASHLLGSTFTLGVDTDQDALEIAHTNLRTTLEEEEEQEQENPEDKDPDSSLPVEFIHLDISDPNFDKQLQSYLISKSCLTEQQRIDGFIFDTVIMNPPFGTKRKGIDMVFLETACRMARTAIYSLHKTSTREHIRKKAKSWGFNPEVLAEMKYDLPKTMKIHKQNTLDIAVDFWRFERIQPRT